MPFRFIARFLSLRLWLPLLVLVYAFVGGLALYFVEMRMHGPRFEADFTATKLLRTAQIQSEVERWVQRDHPEEVQAVFTELGTEPELQTALYLDAADNVLAAARSAWIGRRLDVAALGLAPADQARLTALLQSVHGELPRGTLLASDRNTLFVGLPATRPLPSGRPEAPGRGAIVVGYDLSASKAASLEELRVEFGTYFVSSLLIALAVGLSLHYLVIRRLERVATGIVELAPGSNPPHPVEGGDEIAELSGRFALMAGAVGSEMAQRKRIEQELRRANRVLRTLSTCNQVLIHAATETELLQKVCRIIVEEGGYRMAWVGYAEQDENKTVRPVAHAGHEEGYLEKANISWGDNERGRGPTGIAIRTGQAAVCRNILTDPRFAPWRDEAAKRGYASSLVLPLRDAARTYGALIIYAPEPDVFDQAEVDLLTELADDMVYGLTALRAKEALRQAGAYNRSLIEASLDPLVTIGPDGKITDVNTATEAATGRTRTELVGTDFCDYFSDPAQARAGYQQVFREGLVRDYPLELQHRDGRSISVLYNASVYRDEAGQVIGVFAAARDVTELTRTAETLRQTAGRLELEGARLNEAQAVAQIGSWDLDLRTNILTWSDECFRIFDIDRRRFGASYEAFLERVHPDDRAMVNKAYTDSVANHTSYAIDHRLIRSDGSVRFIHERCHTYYDDEGRPLRSVGTSQDITERKRAEEAILERVRHSQSLLRLSRALERSQSYAEALAAAREEVRAILGYQSLWVYLLTPDRTQLKALMAGGALEPKVMSEEGTATLTIKGDRMLEEIVAAKDIVVVEDARSDPRTDKLSVAKSGVITIVNIPIVLFDQHFGVMGTGTAGDEGVRPPTPVEREYLLAMASHMAVTLDRIHLLTERKRAEDEVCRLNAELEQRVTDRTRELVAANQELESFSYSVSHDLRAPLRSIDGFSRILLEEYDAKLDAEGRDSLQRLRGASQRMGELIDQILKLSHMSRGELRYVPVDLSALAQEIAAELRKTAPERQVEWMIAPDLAVVGDPTLLRIVLQNLLENAWKFTGSRPRACIELGVTATAGGERAYFVRDNGAGFDLAYADKLFSPFQRMHTLKEFPGTGIGLATAQRIIHRHGGRIWADAREDAGATFFFTVPIKSRLS